MFDGLSSKLGSVLDGLKRRGALKESDVDQAMRDVRLALLEADVALPVVKDFIAQVKEKAIGSEVLKSVTPGQMVVKIVNDALVDMLNGGPMDEGAEPAGITLAGEPPAVVLMVGLQGSGKTTSTAKIAMRLANRDKKKVLMASLDVYRPAAQEQLKILGEQVSVATLPIVEGQQPVDIAKRALQAGKFGGYDVVMLDTAGRLHVDEALMDEVAAVKSVSTPSEVMLVADAMTGQDAVNVADSFNKRVGLTGIMLTRVDGDARGGAALSMRAVTNCPIKLLGTGEKTDQLEDFHASRIASRILGMGDVVSLVERARETIEEEDAEKLAKKIQKGQFDLDDMASQLKQMRKMGGMEGLMGMLPGMGKIKDQMKSAKLDENILKRQEAIISSMTPQERKTPKIIHAKRKIRIANGSGTSVQDVNKLLSQYQTMAKMMKKMGKIGQKGMMRSLGGMLGGGGAMGGLGGPMGGPGGGLPPGFMPPGGKR